ncbi:MAG TPA: hypothetical protein VFS67_09835 [Polyangiaceae bacterium]|nr:hypothetical protein [Polyangiaceae bacterium]
MRGSDPPPLPLLLAAGLLLINQAPARGSRGPLREGTASVKLAESRPAASDTYEVAPSCVPAFVVDASGIRRLPDRCGTTEARATPPAMPPGVRLSPPPSATAPATIVPAATSPTRPVIDGRRVRTPLRRQPAR